MNLNEVITRLDAIATDRYPIITDSDVEALKIAMDIVKEKELEFPKEVISSSFDTKMLMDYMKEKK